MTTIKEIQLQSVAEPFSVKIERGQKGGYGYEIGAKCEFGMETDGIPGAIEMVLAMKTKLEKELYGDSNDGKST